jgi:selenocysteine-specific elongation factor
VRGLQSYKQAADVVQPGSRVAVNLTGVDKALVARGHVLTHPRQLQPTLLADVYFRHLKEASRPLHHNAAVKLFVGAAEAGAHARLLSTETLAPGDEGWLQLRLEKPLALAPGDRFILRRPSPAETIGGGVVVDPHPGRRWRRFDRRVIEQLETRLAGTPAERLAQAADQPDAVKLAVLQKQTELSDGDLEAALREALDGGLLTHLPDNTYLATARYNALQQQLGDLVRAFHRAEPLRRGMQREQLRSQLGVRQNTLTALLDALPDIVTEGTLVRLAEHEVRFDRAQQERVERLRAQMAAAPYTPPSYAEAAQDVGEDVLRALIDQGEIVLVQPDVIFARSAYDTMLAALFEMPRPLRYHAQVRHWFAGTPGHRWHYQAPGRCPCARPARLKPPADHPPISDCP